MLISENSIFNSDVPNMFSISKIILFKSPFIVSLNTTFPSKYTIKYPFAKLILNILFNVAMVTIFPVNTDLLSSTN